MLTSVAALAVLLAPLVPADAPSDRPTRCTYSHDVRLAPGLGVQGSAGSFRNSDGILDCDGPFLGIVPTGPGRFLDTGRYGVADPDTCLGGGEAAGEIVFTFPTAKGDRSVRTDYTGVFGGLSPRLADGLLALRVESEHWIAEGSATPLEGDCALRPVTLLRDRGTFVTR